MMNPEELSAIKAKRNAAIIAPAGHGKTEMIVDLVEAADQKVLIVTHTNAGIDALAKRFRKRGIDREKYSITTIAGFCIRWCNAYPFTGHIRNIPVTSKEYYPMQYKGTVLIFRNAWARDILKRTYGCVIVDEYQDCVLEQHQIFLEINKTLPVIVFGDPLQAIFGWAGNLVSWNNLSFEIVQVQTYPWRWHKTNPALGQYLNNIRLALMPGLNGQKVSIEIKPVNKCVRVLPSSCKYNLSIFFHYVMGYKSVLFISKLSPGQAKFSQLTGGIFQNDEPQEIEDLFEIAKTLDEGNETNSSKAIMTFLEKTSTKINTELHSYKKHIESGDFDFSAIRKHKAFGILMSKVVVNYSINSILNVLEWVKGNGTFKIYRKELYNELCRALKYAREKDITVFESVQKIRMLPGLQRKYPGFKMLSSRTVLSKGLEFECVVVDLERSFSVTDYYVAMTRATKEVIVICDNKYVTLEAPKL